MKEYWEVTRERARVTQPIWATQPGFLGNDLSPAAFEQALADLDAHATARTEAQMALAQRRAECDSLFAKLRQAVVRAPAIIRNFLPGDSPLHGDLALVYAIDSMKREDQVLARGQLLVGLWTDFEQTQTAGQPLSFKLSATETVTRSHFQALLDRCLAAQQALADQRNRLSQAKAALRSVEGQVDRMNKRWYAAWTKTFPPGTPEGDAARSLVPTEPSTKRPRPVEIDGSPAGDAAASG